MRYLKWTILALLLLPLLTMGLASRLYTDWLWFVELGYSRVFVTILASYWTVRLLAWLFFSGVLYLNLNLTRKALQEMPNLVLRQVLMNTAAGNLLAPERLQKIFLAKALLVPWLLTGFAGDAWLKARLFTAGPKMGLADPLFGLDVGFYLFRLPFFDLVYQYLMLVLASSIVICGAIYLFVQPPQQLGLRGLFARRGQAHLSVLLALAFLVRAGGYRLQAYQLLYSPRGVTFGAGYTDVAAQLPAYNLLFFLCILAAAAMLYNVRAKKQRLFAGSLAALVLASLLAGVAWPSFIQKFLVEPNEFGREEPYLAYNIDFTRRAYGLDRLERREFPLTGAMSYEQLLANTGTLGNIRLWDWRPLKQTFLQLQGLRRYYRFHDIDTDRYILDGRLRQLMLAARELNSNELPARTWVNERLVYTHGYGVVASPVNEVTGQGLPAFVLRDLPVQGEAGLRVDVPQIYYGELAENYVVTGTNVDEFDYPLGEQNAFTRYNGRGGVALGGYWRRLMLALRFADYRLLVSTELKPESRVHFYRDIAGRVKRLAPFLSFDGDPYLVIHDGRLFWIIDAYTVSNRFPYAEPYQGINYIRNSVKAVVDAYHGTVDFYIFEPDDPLVKAYAQIFPGLFQPADKMPAGLRRHVRYPEYLFRLQAQVYATYHMENTQVFYNREDQWEWPREVYAGKQQAMEPYYTIIRLPGEEEPEFVLMLPFTPIKRDNMVAWLAGRSDGEKYGLLTVYHFPKGELVFGPAQIEARIDQDSRISEQLSLWDQRGSSVIRGNLLVLPVNGSILYVEPLYLQAEQSQLPELARVIVAYGERVVMERTLDEALARVFGIEPGSKELPWETPSAPGLPGEAEDATLQGLIKSAAELYSRAQEALRRSDWAEYGRLQQELGSVLERLEALAH